MAILRLCLLLRGLCDSRLSGRCVWQFFMCFYGANQATSVVTKFKIYKLVASSEDPWAMINRYRSSILPYARASCCTACALSRASVGADETPCQRFADMASSACPTFYTVLLILSRNNFSTTTKKSWIGSHSGPTPGFLWMRRSSHGAPKCSNGAFIHAASGFLANGGKQLSFAHITIFAHCSNLMPASQELPPLRCPTHIGYEIYQRQSRSP